MTHPAFDPARFPNPAIPYVHGRDLLPIRTIPIETHNSRFAKAFAAEDEIRTEIAHLDDEVVRLSERRRKLLDKLAAIHDEIRPRVVGMAGRRRRAVSHEEALPPAHDNAVRLYGRALRAMCMTFLARATEGTTLRQLHVTLHRQGYIIESRRPTKALADALGHETDVGHAIRVKRATYRCAPGYKPSRDALPDF